MKKSKTRYPGVSRLEEGKFEVRVKIISHKTGKERDLKRVVTAPSASAAAVAREKLRESESAETRPARERQRLATYATSWMRGKLLKLKPSTAKRYATTLDLHILPVLGDYFIDAIEPMDIQMWLEAQVGKPTTINSRLRVLRTLLADATARYQLPGNPAARIEAVRERGSRDPLNRLQADELRKVLEEFRRTEPEWYPLFLLLSLTGMRFGEATALKWSDIDEAAKIIWIRRSQWNQIAADTKTGSTRTVPLRPILADALKDHRARLTKEKPPGFDKGWVFLNRKGHLFHTASLRKPIRRVLDRVGIDRRHTTHGFRRTFNNLTRQVATGDVVRSMTGHVTEAMTIHYSHIESEEKVNAVDQMLALMEKVEG